MKKINLDFNFPDDGHGGLLTEGVRNDRGEFSMSKTCFEFLSSKLIRDIDFKGLAKEHNSIFSPSVNSKKLRKELESLFTKLWLDIRGNIYRKTFFRGDFFIVCYENTQNTINNQSDGYLLVTTFEYSYCSEEIWSGSSSSFGNSLIIL